MNSEIKENYVLVSDEHDDICGFANFLNKIFEQFSSQNVIVNLLKYDNAQLSDLLCYLELSNAHRASKHSFVIVNASMSMEEIPEELMVVPTVQEAVDVIHMEEIERDLGF
jgi:hypothetical protein